MDGSETIKNTCLVCKLTKDETEFVIGRNTCKRCRNEKDVTAFFVLTNRGHIKD